MAARELRDRLPAQAFPAPATVPATAPDDLPAPAREVRLVASEPAAEAMTRLTGKHGPVALVQSVRCAACGEPACYRLTEFTAAEAQVLAGEVAGAEVWLDARLLQLWHGTLVVLDLERGYSSGPTLPAGDGMHFVVRLIDPDHPGQERYQD